MKQVWSKFLAFRVKPSLGGGWTATIRRADCLHTSMPRQVNDGLLLHHNGPGAKRFSVVLPVHRAGGGGGRRSLWRD